MNKLIKFLCTILSVVMIFSGCILFTTAANKSIVISSVELKNNTSSSFTVILNGFESCVGVCNYRISIPDFIMVTSITRDGRELIDGTDYKVSDNVIKIIEIIGYEDTDSYASSTVYTVNFDTGISKTGKYTVTMLSNSYFANDSDLSKFDVTSITTAGVMDYKGALKADINTDGSANSTDTLLLRKYILDDELNDTFIPSIADVNADGNINAVDIVALKKYLVRSVVYLSDNGDDANVGTSSDAPVATINKALDLVYENGTVQIVDSYTLPSDFVWESQMKAVEITGGVFDASAVHPLRFNDDVKFTDCTINFKYGSNIYANGNKLMIDSNVTVNNLCHLYGGGTSIVDSTDITILSGSYYNIYGGCNGSTGYVKGDTNVTVGGKVNNDSEYDVDNHGLTRVIFGGGLNSSVYGNTNLTIKENAQSINIYGGGKGATAVVSGETNVVINGGTHMSAYGGSYGGTVYQTNLTLNGGSIQQLFGGCLGSSMTGNTNVKVLGGTVTRRIYGGCYNEASRSGLSLKWANDYHVSGNTNVLLSANADVVFDTSYDDYGIFACSRYGSHFADENSTLTYENQAAQTEFNGKIGQKQAILSLFFPSAAKTIVTN